LAADPDALVARAIDGDRSAVAKLISLVETGGEAAHRAVALLHPHTGNAWSIGITGAPGSGKSTLTDRVVARLRADGVEVGVLAIAAELIRAHGGELMLVEGTIGATFRFAVPDRPVELAAARNERVRVGGRAAQCSRSRSLRSRAVRR